MSSAALQAAPLQSTTTTSLSPNSSPATRLYTSQPAQSRDPYYSQQTSNASPSSTRRPGRRTTGNGASASAQNQPAYHSPTSNAPSSPPVTSSRSATSPSPNSTNLASGYPTATPAEYQRGVPPVAPPRTSSNLRTTIASATTAVPDRTRRSDQAADDRPSNSARMAGGGDGAQDRDHEQGPGSRIVNGSQKERGVDDAVAAASTASRSRRRAHQAQESQPQRSSSTRESRTAPAASATQHRPAANHTSASSSNAPSREASEILNRVVVSQPEVDIERERERMAEAVPHPPLGLLDGKPTTELNAVGSGDKEEGARTGTRSRQDHTTNSTKSKHVRFGEYYLGNTLGEGEFGKVKMGWKQEGGVQVAIKLIRRDSVGTNPTRLAKIYREIAILREISHPNIVRLHEMVETEKHIGIILEYASGGELFDFILNNRYLKDPAARWLFAQLVSGVGYLHKKGIVHRDLKLENLLLDRNRNIIITDFGFANTFNPADELGEEIEYGLSSRDYVKRMELDKILPGGFRRGDLMQTSCGSPCYAAPELVVSDSLYTGRKVDVWSCGVILYAMLAGYLPFDDDPANPEGDNINLLYKYIVSTPLTFPEYVTPHARDLLRRILVPDPRKRADLFEVARHSWLTEYAHVVGFITSSTTTTGDIANATVEAEDPQSSPHLESWAHLERSASVRESTKTQDSSNRSGRGDLAKKHDTVEQDLEDGYPKRQKDNKRRTVQLEYVAPVSHTSKVEDISDAPAGSSSRIPAKSSSQGPVEVNPSTSQPVNRGAVSIDKPLPQEPLTSRSQQTTSQSKKPSGNQSQQLMPPPNRSGREPPRSVSDNSFMGAAAGASIARPHTGESLNSTVSGRGSMGLTNRASYGQPAAPTVADTNAHGRISQPKIGKSYIISNPIPQDEQGSDFGRPSISQVPPKFAKIAGFQDNMQIPEPKAHKRSNTVGGISEKLFGRNSLFGGKPQQYGQEKNGEKTKKYPPVSMSGANLGSDPRPSVDSGRRSISFGFGRKRSGSITGSAGGSSGPEKTKRSSFLPSSFSLKAIGISKEDTYSEPPLDDARFYDDRADASRGYVEGQGNASQSRGETDGNGYLGETAQLDRGLAPTATPPQHHRYPSQGQAYDAPQPPVNTQRAARQYQPQESALPQPEQSYGYPNQALLQNARYPPGFNDVNADSRRQTGSRSGRVVLLKNTRKFTDAYEQEQDVGYGVHHNNGGSSGAARKVMDFFRRRGKAREGSD